MAGHTFGERAAWFDRSVSGMNKLVFPYGIRFQEDGRVEVFPAVEADIVGRRGRGIRATFHLDSGATTSILPGSDAAVLGLGASEGKRIAVRGIAGEPLMGRHSSIVIRLNEKKLRIPIIFIESVSVPRILGREGVFPLFGIIFDEAKRRSAFLEASKERRKIDALF